MALGSIVKKSGLAALLVMAMSAGAFAWEAVATTSLNVRSGPGTGYGVVGVLQRGQVVDVQYCRSGWCFISGSSRANGWASQRYLAEAGGWQPPRPQPVPPPVWNNPRPPVWGTPRPPSWNYPPRPPHWNNPPRPPHWGNPRPVPPRTGGSVCFNGPNGYVCMGN